MVKVKSRPTNRKGNESYSGKKICCPLGHEDSTSSISTFLKQIIMYKWKPKNKKAQKRWNEILEKHDSDADKESNLFLYEQYWDKRIEFNDDREIVYMTDGMYITKDGIILHEKDSSLLDF
jgi:hypothetical protein